MDVKNHVVVLHVHKEQTESMDLSKVTNEFVGLRFTGVILAIGPNRNFLDFDIKFQDFDQNLRDYDEKIFDRNVGGFNRNLWDFD